MKLTNIYNLPDGIFNAVVESIQKPQPDIIRVTELINPPICKQLALEHWDTITADASEFLWSLLGTAVHGELSGQNKNILPFLEKLLKTDITKIVKTIRHYITSLQDNDVLIEKRVTIPVGDIVISGQVDRYVKPEFAIEDYKCTSVWSYLYGIKPEWVAQLNVYRYLFESINYRVKKLTINAILRDWMMSKSIQVDYPKIPFAVIDIPVWSPDKINSYIEERVAIHQSDPLPCNPAERWQRKSTWAIMKDGRKSAVRVKDTMEEAQTYLRYDVKPADQKKCEIVERVGEAIKCKSYCLCRDLCPYNFSKENS